MLEDEFVVLKGIPPEGPLKLISEELIEELIEEPIEKVIVADKPRIDTQHEISLPKVEEVIEEPIDNSPEEQIVENVEEVKQLKREPIVPRGKIIEEDVIPRGFSVKVPDPKVDRIGSEGDKIHLFPRQRPGELGNV